MKELNLTMKVLGILLYSNENKLIFISLKKQSAYIKELTYMPNHLYNFNQGLMSKLTLDES